MSNLNKYEKLLYKHNRLKRHCGNQMNKIVEYKQELQRKDNEINDLKSSIADYQEAVGDYQDELKRKDNIINELKESINNFDVFKEFTFPLMKRDEEQQVISSIDYEWKKSIKEPFLDKIEELENDK